RQASDRARPGHHWVRSPRTRKLIFRHCRKGRSLSKSAELSDRDTNPRPQLSRQHRQKRKCRVVATARGRDGPACDPVRKCPSGIWSCCLRLCSTDKRLGTTWVQRVL